MEIFSSSKQFQESGLLPPEWSEQPHLRRKIRAEYKAPLYELIGLYNFLVNLMKRCRYYSRTNQLFLTKNAINSAILYENCFYLCIVSGDPQGVIRAMSGTLAMAFVGIICTKVARGSVDGSLFYDQRFVL